MAVAGSNPATPTKKSRKGTATAWRLAKLRSDKILGSSGRLLGEALGKGLASGVKAPQRYGVVGNWKTHREKSFAYFVPQGTADE